MEKRTGVRAILCDLDLYVALVIMAALILVTVFGVFLRYFINRPLVWLEEVQLWFIVWIVFLGASAVARHSGHIAIDAFVNLFPRRLRKFSRGIGHVTTMAVLAFVGFYAFRHVQQMYTSGRVTNLLYIPYWLIYLVVPLSCCLMVVTSLFRLILGEPDGAGSLLPKPGGASNV
ncbi:MAG: TRAP transporter small permease [Planctomycetes bacterium]|nr:TRAP transporter small permease [Planctomycetota bacterium]